MKQFLNTLLIFVVLMVGSACQKGDIPASAGCNYTADPTYIDHPKGQVYQDIIDTYIARGLPGISVYIEDNQGAWAGAGGMADIKEGIPFQPCTVSKVASITKMFVGTLAMLLAEDGVLVLGAPVDPWLPSRVVDKVAKAVLAIHQEQVVQEL